MVTFHHGCLCLSALLAIGAFVFWGFPGYTAPVTSGVTISGNVRTISDRAFSGCSSLQEIEIPEGVTSIGDNAFPNRDTLVIHCNEGSYAQAYAEANKIKYELIKE